MTSSVRHRSRTVGSDNTPLSTGVRETYNFPYDGSIYSSIPAGSDLVPLYDVESTFDHTNRRRSSKFIEGSPFLLQRGRYVVSPTNVMSVLNGSTLARYHGRMYSPFTHGYAGQEAPLPPLDDGDPTGYYATAWKQARPDRPDATLAIFLGELRDFPRQFEAKARNFKDGGSLYLNYQFGWVPFIYDLRRLYQAQRRLANRLAQLKRDNGRPIRRRLQLVNDSTEETQYDGASSGFMHPPLSFYAYRSPDYVRSTLTSTNRVWFAGRFRYWVPNIDTRDWSDHAKNALFGGIPGPDVIWELLPWSWLIDWFSNMGDVFSNISSHAIDNMAADYAFIMRETTRCWTTVTTSHLKIWRDGGPIDARASSSRWEETKSRWTGSPYGFGLELRNLSGSQLAILSALGLSRS